MTQNNSRAPNALPQDRPKKLAEPAPSDPMAAVATALESLIAGRKPALHAVPPALAAAFGVLADQLAARDESSLGRTVEFSVQASESMAAAARITGDVREIDDRAQVMSSAIRELDASIGQISDTARGATDEMGRAAGLVQAGARKVHDITLAANRTQEAMNTTGQESRQMAEAVAQIAQFVNTIDAISRQTNLLALNATIEAARAGEAGRGFAVVASEVKVLSGQTRKATEDIGNLIGQLKRSGDGLQQAVSHAQDAVESTRQVSGEAEGDMHRVDEIVSRTAEAMQIVAQVLGEQSLATSELATGVEAIADLGHKAASRANEVVESVRHVEGVIDQQFAALDGREIRNYVLQRAKSDHYLWKKRLSEMLVGLNNLTEAELADHKSCRLGKWYQGAASERYRQDPAFRTLDGPHAAVHQHGRKAAALFARGDREGALAEIGRMEQASHEVVRLLDELISRSQP